MDFDTICFNCYQRTVSARVRPGSSQVTSHIPKNGRVTRGLDHSQL